MKALTTEDTEGTEGLKGDIFGMPTKCGIIVNGDDVARLVHTSVDDLRTQIKFQQAVDSIHRPSLWTLRVAHEECVERGYKTKAKILEAAIKRQEGGK